MVNDIFVNLAVRDLQRSIDFFGGLGFTFNPQFTDETATCMILGEHMFAMLITEEKFRSFTPKQLCDARTHTEVLTCVSLGSPQQVDAMVAKAIAGGGSGYNEAQDHGFMYQHGFQDPDGHIWELVAFTSQ